jgi:orotate phosphoribosyltransferase
MSQTEEQKANRAALLNLIAPHSFKLGDFTLASGRKSDYYIDCRISTLHAEGGRLAGLVLLDLIRRHAPEAEAVGGLTMGADPLVAATSTASAWALNEYNEIAALFPDDAHEDPNDPDALGLPPTLLHGFLVRKSEKTHGTGRRLEGFLKPGAKVVIVDDVCTTGGSTITAIEATRDAGMQVIAVLCLVDREQGGRLHIEQALAEIPTDDADREIPFLPVFTATDVRKAHIALK